MRVFAFSFMVLFGKAMTVLVYVVVGVVVVLLMWFYCCCFVQLRVCSAGADVHLCKSARLPHIVEIWPCAMPISNRRTWKCYLQLQLPSVSSSYIKLTGRNSQIAKNHTVIKLPILFGFLW